MSSLSGGTAYVDVALGKTDDLKRGISEAGSQAADTAKSSFLSRVGSMALGTALGGALATGASKAVDFAKEAVIGFNSQIQQATIGFTTMLGSSKAAGDYIQQLQTFAKSTPFEFGDLVSQAQQMMGMGIAAKDVIPDLTALGDSVASIGGSASQVDSVTLAFDQMNAKGTLDMGNLNQLMQNGVPNALKILADHYKTTTGQMIQMISTGKVQASEALPALISGLEKGTASTAALGGMMQKQSLTMQGALSNVADSATQAIAGAFKPVFDAASKSVQGLANVLGSDAVQNGAKKINSWLSGAFSAAPELFAKVKDRAYDLFGQIRQPALDLFAKIQGAVQQAAPIIKELFLDKLGMIKTVIHDALPVVEQFVRGIGPVLGEVLRAGEQLLTQHILPALMKVSAFVQHDIIPAVADFVSFAVQKVLPILRDVGEIIAQKVMPIVGRLADLFVQRVLPALRPLIRDGFALLKDVVAKLAPVVQDLVHWFADNALPVLERVATFVIGTLIPFLAQVADVLLKVLRPALDIVVWVIKNDIVPTFKITADIVLGLVGVVQAMAKGVIMAIHGISDVIVGWKLIISGVVTWVSDKFDWLVQQVTGLPGKIARVGHGMWDWLMSEFRGALNTVIRWWDEAKFTSPKIHIPGTPSSWDIGPVTIGLPYIKPLAQGGLVLPQPGGSIVRVAEAGEAEVVAPERAIEAAVSRALAAGRVGRDGPVAVFNYSGTQAPTREQENEMNRQLARALGL